MRGLSYAEVFFLKAVILAGGYGTRMKERCRSLPKPMISVCGKPILQHQIETLRSEGIHDFIIVTHYLSEVIKEYFKDGSDFGVNIEYFVEETPQGTAGSLSDLHLTEDFLLCNGDLIFNISLSRMIEFHREKNALITLLTHPSSHPCDSTTLIADSDGRVVSLLFKNQKTKYYPTLCNSGIHIVSPEIFEMTDIPEKANFDKDIVEPCIKSKRVFSYKSPEYVFDVGNEERLQKAEADIISGAVKNRRFDVLHKAVFLDRDGTVNKYKGYITEPEQIELIDGVADAISNFHAHNYLVIIITNQPVIARGDCTFEQLDNIHYRLEELLAEKGTYIDGLYYCPHHPDSGFPNEIKELKIKCDCRKPNTGLIRRAKEDFNIDLSMSYMVGDSDIDILAAKKSGCIPVFIGENNNCTDSTVIKFLSLKEFSDSVITS